MSSALLLSRPAGVAGVIAAPLVATANRVSGLNRLDHLYRRARQQTGEGDFLDAALATLDVRTNIDPQQLSRVPGTGPLIVVSNHPFGGIEGMALAQALRRQRPDLRILANHLLGRIPELDPLMIHVDPFGGATARQRNQAPLRRALGWLRDGGALLVFPAGAVSHWHLSQRAVTDPPWQPAVAWLARRSRAAVLPVFVDGRNGALFQLAGLVSPQLRTALLVRELLRSRRSELRVTLGRPIDADELDRLGDDAECTAWLRLRVYALGHRAQGRLGVPTSARHEASLIPAPAPERLLAEVEGLPAACRLLEQGDFCIYLTQAGQIPTVLEEIGRLRELTFRAAGEGTGNATDLDRFDPHYLHLWLWDRAHGRLAGAYRLAPVDRVLAAHGPRGLYINSLFRFRRGALHALGGALELGRSFVAADYQRDFQPLLLLWQGIGRFLVANPSYYMLVGPVSVARSYSDPSRTLMAQCLGRDGVAAQRVGPVRGNFRPRPLAGLPVGARERLLRDADAVATLVSAIEDDGKGLPVLLRHYLKLNGEVLAWNVDHDFGDALDALLLVDLRRSDPRLLRRYMGAAGAADFLARHAAAA